MSAEDSLNRGVAFADTLVEALADNFLGEVGPVERLLFATGFLSRVTGLCGGVIGAGATKAILEKTKGIIDQLQADGAIE